MGESFSAASAYADESTHRRSTEKLLLDAVQTFKALQETRSRVCDGAPSVEASARAAFIVRNVLVCRCVRQEGIKSEDVFIRTLADAFGGQLAADEHIAKNLKSQML